MAPLLQVTFTGSILPQLNANKCILPNHLNWAEPKTMAGGCPHDQAFR
ncbi:hypothetical protein Ptr902_02005 [Pyrenophora tritici-repentis]|nr:hypothetical protein Ptr902_02005 [Pyrenophora tritici-repentis]